MSISKKQILHTAKLAKLSLQKDELDAITDEMGKIVTFVEQINEPDSSKTEPLSSVMEEYQTLRKDEPGTSLPIEDTETNAPEFENGHFVVPAVIE